MTGLEPAANIALAVSPQCLHMLMTSCDMLRDAKELIFVKARISQAMRMAGWPRASGTLLCEHTDIIYVYIYIHTHICMYACMYVFMYVSAYIYIERERQ